MKQGYLGENQGSFTTKNLNKAIMKCLDFEVSF